MDTTDTAINKLISSTDIPLEYKRILLQLVFKGLESGSAENGNTAKKKDTLPDIGFDGMTEIGYGGKDGFPLGY